MFAIYKDFTLNFFYVFFIPAVMFALIRRTKENMWMYRLSVCIVSSISLLSSMSVPVSVNGLIFDFRAVPLVVGSLYGGIPVSVILYSILIVYRYLMGNPNQLEYIASILPTLLIIGWIAHKFSGLSVRNKVLAGIASYFIVRMVTLTGYFLLIGNLDTFIEPKFVWTMALIVFQCLLTGAFIYLLEYLEKVHHLQEEIRKTEKLRLVTGIAASVAHEVRNPLTAVRGFIQLLGKEDISENNRSYYKKICLEELDRAQQIISDYLTLAKPDPEKIESIEINSEIRYTANVLSSYAIMQNVEISFELCEHDLQLSGDRSKFRQALINLCKNSIEAMSDGGTLTLQSMLQPSEVVICINDTGVGMTKDQLMKLGTPFYSTKEKGTGLGTMVTFSIIRNMHGTIVTTSDLGKGTTFRLSFPLGG